VTNDGSPTMVGFKWSAAPPYVPTVPDENGWCVRDAICKLIGWKPGSEEWQRFTVEGPKGTDLIKLGVHLRLTVFDLTAPGAYDELSRRAAHPGVALFGFDEVEKSHVMYVPDVRWLLRYWPTPDGFPNQQPALSTGWPLGPQHMERGPVLFAVLINEREPPRPVG